MTAHVWLNSRVGLGLVPADLLWPYLLRPYLLRPYLQVTNLQFYCLGSFTRSTVAVVAAALTAGVGVMVRGGPGGGIAVMVDLPRYVSDSSVFATFVDLN